MKKIDLCFASLIIMMSIYLINEPFLFVGLFFVSSCYLWIRANGNLNITSTIAVIVAIKLLELILLSPVLERGNYILYSTWMLLDLIVVSTLMFKVNLLRMIGLHKNQSYVITRADMILGAIYSLYFLINFFSTHRTQLKTPGRLWCTGRCRHC